MTARSLAKSLPAEPLYRLHPRITLEVCHICLGRGFVLAIRRGGQTRERCSTCGTSGTIVHDDGNEVMA